MKDKLGRWIYLFAAVVVFGYGIYSLIFRRVVPMWGLPSTFWYSMWILTAVLVILIEHLAKKD